MTISEYIASLQREIDYGNYRPDDQVFGELWLWDDVFPELDGFYDTLTYDQREAKAREIWALVATELRRYDEYPDRDFIRSVVARHVEADKQNGGK